ncbi:hypothetical protein HNP46_002200 [Pseudomonas nitritireducens]|uniref:Phage tail assembly protein n=1 Tax=Pseudomonas nitroreducens TaxID=46680 RepID=A0A7W7KJ99_PSENT|nr:phage tail assembly protein [Pseudomonas nitritireducens]MBB4863353.1 hypothetical protein [Pseudomonas nitritireducens]
MQDTLIITFSKPISLGKGDDAQVYETVELREPTAGELEKASRADTSIGIAINLIGLIGKIPRSVVEKMSQRDLRQANEFLSGFSDGGQPEDGQS